MEGISEVLYRPIYMDRIIPYMDQNIIKILVGQRRVGKSYILKNIAQEAMRRNPDANFVTINLEDFAFSHITSAGLLHEEIISRLSDNRKNYIFLDEVQEIRDFDKVVRSLILDSRNDIYLTGSNSDMLSAEIASRLAGRSIQFHIHPLTYREFLEFHSLTDSDSSLATYLRYGGLPYLMHLPEQSTWAEYLRGITDAVVYRDVVARHSLRNTDFLQRLLLFLADNIGQIFNAKRISDFLKSQKVSASVTGVQSYLEYIKDAYIVNRVRRWDIEGKRYFEFGEKVFFEDLGIRNSIVGYRPNDIGGLMENAVHNHLAASNYDVKVGVGNQGHEIDFIAEKDNEYRYVQVALSVMNDETARREFGNLADIPDNYEKTVVTYAESSPNTYQGIRQMSLREFLLS